MIFDGAGVSTSLSLRRWHLIDVQVSVVASLEAKFVATVFSIVTGFGGRCFNVTASQEELAEVAMGSDIEAMKSPWQDKKLPNQARAHLRAHSSGRQLTLLPLSGVILSKSAVRCSGVVFCVLCLFLQQDMWTCEFALVLVRPVWASLC